MHTSRRSFLKQAGGLAAGLGLSSLLPFSAYSENTSKKMFFEISLAEWSFNKSIFGKQMSNLDFPVKAKKEFGISVVEYVNTLFFDNTHSFKENGSSQTYLKELLMRCKDNGVKNHLIMCDAEGDLGDLDESKRKQTVENHYKWVEAAKFLGCATIRVNAAGQGTAEEVKKAAIDGLGRLSEFAKKAGINVIVENHGGYSSDGQWLAWVMKGVNMPNCGTLPDFGNFCIERSKPEANTMEAWYKTVCLKEYDKYKGTQELMPFAKGVSAKSNNFDEKGDVVETDYYRMLKIVKDAGFKGYIGIEYEGQKESEEEGIRKTKALLEKVGNMLS
jgi:sugar phosphate isomerase/epimerase